VALGDLQISWTGAETGEIETTDEFDIPVVLEDDLRSVVKEQE
jgi:segregation and condensation protein A